jgi:hypothetical protein
MNSDIYFEIPNFKDYVISKTGIVFNKKLSTFLKGSINPAGYCHYRLLTEDGIYKTVGRHRLMAMTFLEYDGKIDQKYVNHLNGIKGDDRIENLEWATPLQNIHHAGMLGLTPKCTPVETIDLDGNVKLYPSATDCGRDLGITKDAVLWRLKSKGKKLFSNGLRFREKRNENWPDQYTYEGIEVRLVEENKTMYFNKLKDAADYLKVSASTITSWLKDEGRTYLNSIQIRTSNNKWPPIVKSEQINDFIVIDGKEVMIFNNLTVASDKLNIGKSTIHYRLKQGTDKPFKDGRIYLYLTDYEAFKNSPPN